MVRSHSQCVCVCVWVSNEAAGSNSGFWQPPVAKVVTSRLRCFLSSTRELIHAPQPSPSFLFHHFFFKNFADSCGQQSLHTSVHQTLLGWSWWGIAALQLHPSLIYNVTVVAAAVRPTHEPSSITCIMHIYVRTHAYTWSPCAAAL